MAQAAQLSATLRIWGLQQEIDLWKLQVHSSTVYRTAKDGVWACICNIESKIV